MYYGARYYDPELGRFIQPDTVLDGLNRYAYCRNNPVRYVDPDGHDPHELQTPDGEGIPYEPPDVDREAYHDPNKDSGSGSKPTTTQPPTKILEQVIDFLFNFGVYVGFTEENVVIGIGKVKYVNGNWVIQNDNLINLNLVDGRNRTNLQRMQQGLSPITDDGKSVVLHHVDQTMTGPLVEVKAQDHTDHHGTVHSNTGQKKSEIDRDEADKYRKSYWESRAEDFR